MVGHFDTLCMSKSGSLTSVLIRLTKILGTSQVFLYILCLQGAGRSECTGYASSSIPEGPKVLVNLRQLSQQRLAPPLSLTPHPVQCQARCLQMQVLNTAFYCEQVLPKRVSIRMTNRTFCPSMQEHGGIGQDNACQKTHLPTATWSDCRGARALACCSRWGPSCFISSSLAASASSASLASLQHNT